MVLLVGAFILCYLPFWLVSYLHHANDDNDDNDDGIYDASMGLYLCYQKVFKGFCPVISCFKNPSVFNVCCLILMFAVLTQNPICCDLCCFGAKSILLQSYLIFFISFTRAKFPENKIYTEKCVNYKKWISR